MSLSHQDVVDIYERLKLKALNFYRKKSYQQSLNYITYSAKWAYHLNFRYVDEELECLIKKIADCCLSKIKVNSNKMERFVLLETHGMDNRGLTQQYIRAFMAMGVEFLYVSVDCKRSRCSDIIRELKAYGKVKIILYENSTIDNIEKAKNILSEIELYQPSKVFLHLMPWDVVSLMVTHSVHGVIKYNINLTDHAFWLGSTFIDFNFEFRSYGKTVSLEKRLLNEEQLLYLPFYPILSKDKVCFQGFPSQTENKTIIFTGGAFYKMFGNNDIFFNIIDSLLELSDKAMVLIAGGGDMYMMNEKLSKLKNKERVLLIGNRKDINEVFKTCDIYLDTYPIRGGLMEQYASLHEKAILAFSDFQNLGDSQENMLDSFGNGVCGYNDWNLFIEYAKKLLSDIQFRNIEGKKNLYLVPSEDDFNHLFQHLVTTHTNVYKWNKIAVNYVRIRDLYLEVENVHTHTATKELMKKLRINVFRFFPQYAIHFLNQLIKVLYYKWT